MTHNLYLNEGIYDADPNNAKTSIYFDIFKKYPKTWYDAHDIVIDAKKLEKYVQKLKLELHYTTISRWDDGEERNNRVLFNKDTQIIVIISQKLYASGGNQNIETDLDEDGEILPTRRRPNNNPNKFNIICFLTQNSEDIAKFKKFIESIIIEEESKNKLFMLKQTEYGNLALDSFPMNCDDTDLELNYGKNFLKVHDSVTSHLEKKKSGLYIFHGFPGTGKTTYVKYLTTVVDFKKFIFVPNTMVSNIFSPKFVDKLYSFRNSVLVLEDAEVCVFKRDGTNNELVSGILNITDGLLKDLLNISIIVTFNAAETRDIDDALLRKGRLQIMHKFSLLSIEDATRLAEKLGMKNKITKPTSLADVYNLDETTGLEEEETKVTGFGFAAR